MTDNESFTEDYGIYSDSEAASLESPHVVQKLNRALLPPVTGYTPSKKPVTRRRRASSARSSTRAKTDLTPGSLIFRNLLILEDSLRQQARTQQTLKRQFTLFLAALLGVAGFAFYMLYFADEPRPSGMSKLMLQFLFFFILVTVVLFHLSGEYKRTIVIPRKFFANANKGIRQFNVKLIQVKRPWMDVVTDWIRTLLRRMARSAIYICDEMPFKFGGIRERWVAILLSCQPRLGGVDVKLVLNPRSFTTEIREGWEIYRDEFWAREASRRLKSLEQNTMTKSKTA